MFARLQDCMIYGFYDNLIFAEQKPNVMKSILRIMAVIIAILPLFIAQSCKKEPGPYADNTYLVSSHRELTYDKTNVLQLLNTYSTSYPGLAAIIPDVESGVIVYSIVYKTTFKGEDLLVSGLVAIPSAVGSYPVIAYQNGTNTLHSNAPSVMPYYPLYTLLELAASTGYVVVIADYIGFGESDEMVHPYLHKESTVQTIVDMLYALREFDDDEAKDITMENEYYLMGYSQGGWATLALLEALENDYAADFNVQGTVCGAGPYDMTYFNSYVLGLTEYPMPVFLGYIANAYSEYDFFTNQLSDMFNTTYAGIISSLYDGTRTSDYINSQLSVYISELFRADYISGFASSSSYQSIRDALDANSIDAWDTNVPLLLIHGTDDIYVPPVISENMYNAMITAGTSDLICTYQTVPDADHSEGIVPAGLAGLAFFREIRGE